MKNRWKTGLPAVFIAAGLTTLGMPAGAQSPAGNPSSSQAPSSANPQTSNPTVDQMQRQSEQHMDDGAKKMAKSGDDAFAIKAAQGGEAEVKLGKLAAEKASDADVKAFGQQMVDDHTKANEQLKAIASEKGMKLPEEPGPKHQAMYEKLSKLSGAEFDKAYVKNMVKDHEEDVKDFTKESNKGKDEKIKGFATETLPVLQGHLEKIKGIQGKMSSMASNK